MALFASPAALYGHTTGGSSWRTELHAFRTAQEHARSASTMHDCSCHSTVSYAPCTQVAKLPARNVRNDNFLQRLLVTWVYAIVNAGRRGKLQREALCMPADQAAEVASDTFLKQWARERAEAAAAAPSPPPPGGAPSGAVGSGAKTAAPRQPSLARALRRSFGWEFALAGVFKLLWSGFVLLGASYFVNVSCCWGLTAVKRGLLA